MADLESEMNWTSRVSRFSSIALNAFLAVTAIGGGVCLLSGLNAPPVEFLRGSPFHGYLVPGLALTVLVGGSAAVAFVLVLRRSRHAVRANLLAAAAIIIFETVEIAVIGSPAGVARNLQLVYFSAGFAIGGIALGAKMAGHPPARHQRD
jgi:hypothetical protein